MIGESSERALLVRELNGGSLIPATPPNTKLLLEQRKQTASSFHLAKMEVLPLNNLIIGSICQGCKYQMGNPGTSFSR